MITLEPDKWYRCKEKDGLAIAGFRVKIDAVFGDMYLLVSDDPHMYKRWMDRSTGEIDGTTWVVDPDSGLSIGEQNVMFRCTCGGYTTYNSYNPEYHSYWCDTRKV